jgi:electron transfer flavoprotein alpha subunit
VKNENGLVVLAEQREGRVHPVAYELLGKGREIADRLGLGLAAVLLGDGVAAGASELIYHGADRVFLYEHPIFRDFDLLNYEHNIVKLLRGLGPEICLLGATHLGRSLGPRIAVALATGLTADCTGLEVAEDGSLIQVRPAFSGNILAQIKTSTRPQMATVRYKVMPCGARDAGRRGEIVRREPEIVPSRLTLVRKETCGEASLAEADVIVSGGRGLRKAEDFSLLAELAGLLGGAVGASRPLVDDSWIGREHQVGFSGNTVKPRIYIACGISGSPQHLAGMRLADVIIAINSDPSAPIFGVADYGIVGDLYDVVPRLIEKVKKQRP